MKINENILISLESRHADNIFSGQKTVELRRRRMNIDAGATVWIYEKLPAGSIVGKAKIAGVFSSSPAVLWKKFGGVACLTKKEFFDYFDGVSQGVALVLENAERLDTTVSLTELRCISEGFHPPQFFIRLRDNNPILEKVASGF